MNKILSTFGIILIFNGCAANQHVTSYQATEDDKFTTFLLRAEPEETEPCFREDPICHDNFMAWQQTDQAKLAIREFELSEDILSN